MVSDGSFPQEDFKAFVPPMQSQTRRERARARKYVRRRRGRDLIVPMVPIPEVVNLLPSDMLDNLRERSNRNLISNSLFDSANKTMYIPTETVSPTTSRAHGSSIEPTIERIHLESSMEKQIGESAEKVNLDRDSADASEQESSQVNFESSVSVTYENEKEKQGNALFIVEPQEDFQKDGSLPTVNAGAISQRISSFLLKNMEDIDQVYISLNSRRHFNISHSSFWIDENGSHPEPLQQLELDDIKQGKWIVVHEEHREWISQYVDILMRKGRKHLSIWPEHCIVGTRSSNIMKNIMLAVKKWEMNTRRAVRFILKGKNSLTEHFSAFQAEVPIDGDTSTQMNVTLLEELKNFKRVIICGFAATDGVKHTVLDLVNRWNEGDMNDIVILGNAISYIHGKEDYNELFLEEMEMARGLTIDTTDLQLRKLTSPRMSTPEKSEASITKEGDSKIVGKNRYENNFREEEHEPEAAAADGDEVIVKKEKIPSTTTRLREGVPSRFKWTRTFHGNYKRVEILDSTSTL